MTAHELEALSPFAATAGLALVLLLTVAFTRRHAVAFRVAVIGLLAVAATLPLAAARAPARAGQLDIDRLSLLYSGLLLGATLLVALVASSYWERRGVARDPEAGPGEFYFLLVIALLGGMVLVAADNLITAFLGLETLSVPLYVLIAYRREERRSVEAGLKYLILAGASSAFLLFGIALTYAELGTMDLHEMAELPVVTGPGSVVALGGLALILVGIGFKLALVPFHFWTPDVYQGAPAPVSGFVATVSKGAVLGFLLRWSLGLDEAWSAPLLWTLGPIAAASMIAGNLLALLQTNVKRILAYSSIAHLGYALVALLALAPARDLAAEAVTFYLAAYFVTMLGAFGVIAALSDEDGEPDQVDDFRGLFWRRPWPAALFTALLLSLAGIPVTAGFIGKVYVMAAGIEGSRWWLVVLLVVTSAIGLFYYLRIVTAMFAGRAEEGRSVPRLLPAGGMALGVVAALLVLLGLWPEPMIRWIGWAIGAVGGR